MGGVCCANEANVNQDQERSILYDGLIAVSPPERAVSTTTEKPRSEQKLVLTSTTECKNGHELKRHMGNPYDGANIDCDLCENEIEPSQIANGFMRCAECECDICNECAPPEIVQ